MRLRVILILLGLLCVSSLAHAQSAVTASSGFNWTDAGNSLLNADGSPVIARYEVRFQPGTGCAAVAAFNAGKPAPDVNGIILAKPIPSLGTLTANCTYTAVIAAIGPTGLEGVSVASDPFVRVVPLTPTAPSKPTVLP